MARTGRLTAEQETVAAAVAARLGDGPHVVALSGGGDSASLAWAVAFSGRTALAVTVDHGLAVSSALVAAATEIAGILGMEHRIVAVEPGSGTEADLRVARLAALEAAAADATILTAHTSDDQAETVLGNLLRGAGPTGLAGIPERRGRWLRPLLGVTRATTRAAAAASGLPFVDDLTNLDTSLRRNRLRLETIPALESEFNPTLRQALARTARFAAEDDALLTARADAVPLDRVDEAVLIPAAALATLPSPVAARLARRALRLLHDPYPGEAPDVLAVVDAVRGGVHQLTGGMLAEREGPWVALHPATSGAAPAPVVLPIPGSVSFGRWRIAAGGESPGLGRMGALVGGKRLVVRAAVPGDRIEIGGGFKKVSVALGEIGVARRLRSQWPVVEDDGRIAWVVGIRAAPPIGTGRVALAARQEPS